MSTGKRGRKRKLAYRKYKRGLQTIIALHKASEVAQAITGIAIQRTQINKCMRCKHKFEEQLGGVIVHINKEESICYQES